MKPDLSAFIEGVFQHLIYSPKGAIEGALIESDRRPLQLVIGPQNERSALKFLGLKAGQSIRVKARPQGVDPKGRSPHPIYEEPELLKVDGQKPAKTAPLPSGYSGRVVRLNYARHGDPNGVILDSGDFIHLKPDGMSRLHVKLGDVVHAEGGAQRLADDTGWAVEATHVNGKTVKKG